MNLDQLMAQGRERTVAGDLEGAEGAYRALLASSHDEPLALKELAGVLCRGKRHEEAADLLRLSISYDHTNADAWRMLGACWGYLGRHQEAGFALQEALRYGPEAPAAEWNYALWLLKDGQYEAGWEKYRYGRLLDHKQRTLKPEWNGRSFHGKTLLLWAEQGFGDTIQFVRYVEAAQAASGAQILLEVPGALVGLLGDCPFANMVYKHPGDDSLPYHFDAHASLMSLPRLLKMYEPWYPGQYIFSHDEVHYEVQAGPRIGLCWHGSHQHTNAHQRNLSPEFFDDIRRSAPIDATWVSLQQEGAPMENIECYPLADWTDTAAVIKTLDLVITVDTAVAHLAGAMGKDVWLLLPRGADWRWGRDADFTAWYPKMVLFRQSNDGSWAQARHDLQYFLDWHFGGLEIHE